MNKIIEELSQQAIEQVSKLRMVDGQEEYSWKPEDYDRVFAELLIHETASLFDPSEKSELGYRIADRIYKHFDIK
jgi:hypothetical protein